jgi:hypothetical protein
MQPLILGVCMNINSYALITAISALGLIVLADILPEVSSVTLEKLFQTALSL